MPQVGRQAARMLDGSARIPAHPSHEGDPMTITTTRTLSLCVGMLALAACGKGTPQQGAPQMPTPEVGVITLKAQTVPLTKDLVGRLSAFRSADVRARVAG